MRTFISHHNADVSFCVDASEPDDWCSLTIDSTTCCTRQFLTREQLIDLEQKIHAALAEPTPDLMPDKLLEKLK